MPDPRQPAMQRTIAATIARVMILLAIIVFPLAAPSLRFVEQIDNMLVSWRFSAAPREASGKIAYVAIDKRSLDSIGVWPWPRSVHADLVDRLTAAGAGDIFIDVDFSTPSQPAEDARLAQALAEAGGGVILPVFLQYAGAEAGAERVVTRPFAPFAAQAWLAFANVGHDNDGQVRHFSLGAVLDGVETQSVPAVLSGVAVASGSLPIDYSIDPTSVPTFSVADVLSGKVGREAISGRNVVIGAYATELKDIFPVPAYGSLSGPMLHILAAETVLQKRVLAEFDQQPFELLLGGVIALGVVLLRARPSAYPVLALLAMGGGGETAAFLLQKHHAVLIHTTVFWALVAFGLLLVLTEKVDFRGLLLELADVQHRNTRRLLKRVVADSADGVIAFDEWLNVVEESTSARPLLGVAPGVSSLSLDDFLPSGLLASVRTLVEDYGREPDRAITATVCLTLDRGEGEGARHLEAAVTISPVERHGGDAYPVERPSFAGCMIVRDMTARMLYEEKLQRLALYDDLTGLLGRRAFIDQLNQLDGCCHVAVLDLHRFSVLNATMGRDVGDDLLRAVALRLGEDRFITLLGRLGGDVFCVAVLSPSGRDESVCAERLLSHFREPFDLAGSMVYASARLGICTSPVRNGDADTWIEDAEHALGEAQAIAGTGWRSYDPEAAIRQTRARQIEKEMRPGLQRGEFFLLYQPQVELRSGLLRGAEALVRWQHPSLGFVSPGEFIPIAESSGAICELGRFALMEGCRQAAAWPNAMSVAINVSPVQFSRSDVVADVRMALAASGLAPERLHLEITETAFVEGDERVQGMIGQLRALGVAIALDDFGTGYSSLSYMTGFPLDKLKIDQSFVRKIASDPRSLTIVQTIRLLASGLDLKVVAEGIETAVERDMLDAMGCEVGQGFYFGKPQTSDELLRLLSAPHWSVRAELPGKVAVRAMAG